VQAVSRLETLLIGPSQQQKTLPCSGRLPLNGDPPCNAPGAPFLEQSREKAFSVVTINIVFIIHAYYITIGSALNLDKMFLYTILGFTLSIGIGAAQSTTVSLFLPDTDPQSLVASVVSAVSHAALISASSVHQLTYLSFSGCNSNDLPDLLPTRH